MDYDLRIVGGTLVDGTGAPGRRGDLGIRDGRLVAVGDAPGRARETVDASGQVVAPGFVDIHTHYDAQVFWDRLCTISPWHGVTSVVIGNCGFGVAPTRPDHRRLILRTLEKVEGMSLASLEAGCGTDWPFETFPQYLEAVERRGIGINIGAFLGHTPMRLYVMGEEATERAATPAEVARMQAIVREAMAAGALGIASSKAPTHVGYEGRPVPSRLAELAELQALASAMAESGRGILQATAGPGLFLDEFRTLARATGRPITWTALLAGMLGPGSGVMLLERSKELVREGLPITPQVACRPLNFEFDFVEPFPFESLPTFTGVSAADREGKIRIYRDPAFRQVLRDTFTAEMAGPFRACWDRIFVAYCPQEPALEERSLADIAAERHVDPIDFMFDLALASDLAARFRMAIVNFDEDEVGVLLRDPDTVLGLSDAGAHASQLCDACFSTHLLSHWVRERGLLSVEEAVRMLTTRPASIVGITDRGRLAPGLAADVTVFDPATVAASPLRRVRDLPAGADRLVSDATGVALVVVNGTIVRRDGQSTVDAMGALPGRVLRGGHA